MYARIYLYCSSQCICMEVCPSIADVSGSIRMEECTSIPEVSVYVSKNALALQRLVDMYGRMH